MKKSKKVLRARIEAIPALLGGVGFSGGEFHIAIAFVIITFYITEKKRIPS